MTEKLFPYYERELRFIRQAAADFARQYPAAAGRLLLEPNRSADPHVERLIESFALISGRIRKKLDDEFPELTDGLLGVLYPHYLAPIPSMSVAQFDLDVGRAELPQGFLIERRAKLLTQALDGLRCEFQTAYPVTLWPVELKDARYLTPPFPTGYQPPPGTAAAVCLDMECRSELTLAGLELETLRFYLFGDNQLVGTLYELIFNDCLQVVYRPLDSSSQSRRIVRSPSQVIHDVGFAKDEGLLPYPDQSFLGYRLLTEFFSFPEKFQFFDLGGFQRIREAGFQRRWQVVFFLGRTAAGLEQAVGANTFRLGCTPVVNLFEKTTEPIRVTNTRSEYPIVPDVAHPGGLEVYSVVSVTGMDAESRQNVEYAPFYSFRHGRDRENTQAFWHVTRRESRARGDRGYEADLHLVDLAFDPFRPTETTLVIRTLCSNRDAPSRLNLSDVQFELRQAAPISGVRCLKNPTPTLRRPLRRRGYWRLLSHLSLNHLSIADADSGREALQEILSLYDFSDAAGDDGVKAATSRWIRGISSVSSRRVARRVPSPEAVGFCRGVEVTIEFDDLEFADAGLYLFAAVLERFLGLYASVNSFSQLTAKRKHADQPFKRWPARAGLQPIL